MGLKKIEHLGRSTEPDGAARIDDIKSDHKVSTDAACEAASAFGYLSDVTEAAAPLVQTVDPTTHKQGLTINSSTALELGVVKLSSNPGLPDCPGGAVGDLTDPTVAQATHQHDLVAPEDVSTKLWTAQVPDPLTKLAVDAVLVGPEGSALMWDAFTQVDSRTYKFFSSVPTAWLDGVEPFNGMRLLQWNNLTADTHMERRVVYVLTNGGPTHPQFDTLTVADDFPANIADVPENTHVTVGGGTAYNGYIFARKTENVLGWEPAFGVVDSPTNELLDAQHLSRAATHDAYADLGPQTGEGIQSGMLMLAYRSEQLSGVSFPVGSKFKAHLQLSMLISTEIGMDWSTRTGALVDDWKCTCYGDGKFVTVAYSGGHAMVSSNGIDWTSHVIPGATNNWFSVCYGNGVFVAVGQAGTGNRVMTSTDGLNWTLRTSAADNTWTSVCYGNGVFVAVASSGTGNRVMTSTNGIDWTAGTSIPNKSWRSVCYGNGIFVAVAYSGGTGQRVMTSTDGIAWTLQTTPADIFWGAVCYGGGLFVAVAFTGTGNRVMTSPNGADWELRNSPADIPWESVIYAEGGFIASSTSTSASSPIMTSPNGIDWTLRAIPANGYWKGLAFGGGKVVATAYAGSGTRLMSTELGVFEAVVMVGKSASSDPSTFTATQGSGYSTAVTSTAPGSFDIDIITSGDVLTIGPDEYFTIGVNNVLTSGTGSNILHFTYNDGPHSSYITLPVDLGLFGTKNHQQLTLESRGFSPAQVTEAATHTHPITSLLPGLIQDNSTELTLGTYNVLSVPTANMHWIGTLANSIYGMGVPTFESGCTATVKVYFTADTSIVHLAGGLVGPPASAEQKQFYLTPAVAADPQTEFTYTFPAKSVGTFEYIDAKWHLVDMTYPGFRQDRIIGVTSTAGILPAPKENFVTVTSTAPVLGMLPPTLTATCTAPIRLEFVYGATISFIDDSVDSANRFHPGTLGGTTPTPFFVSLPPFSYLDVNYIGGTWHVVGASAGVETTEISSDSDGQWFLSHSEGSSYWIVSQQIYTGAALSVTTSGGVATDLIPPTEPDLPPPLVAAFPAGRWGGDLFLSRSGGDGSPVVATLKFGLYNVGDDLVTTLATTSINVTTETAFKHVMRAFKPAFKKAITGLALKVSVSVVSSSATPVTVSLSNPDDDRVCTLHIPCLNFRKTNTALGFLGVTKYDSRSSGVTFTKNAACTKIKFLGRGAGSGGGAACINSSGCTAFGAGGGGGGQGGRIEGWLDMTGITSITGITVGAGGPGGIATSTTAPSGSTGGDTSFTCDGTSYVAKGAIGGQGCYSAVPLSATPYITNGGAGQAGTNDVARGSPGMPGYRWDGGPKTCYGGAGGGDGGGAGNSSATSAGSIAHGEGSGGGGALVITTPGPTNVYRNGGSGDDGYLWFEEWT
jgi:hypothetical protein